MHVGVWDLSVSYGEHRVLQEISFTVERGEFVSIVGKSGCGKSTLLNALAGFINSEGKVQIPADVGVVFQNYAVFPWLTVRGNIAFGLHQIDAKQRDALIARYLEMTALVREADKYPSQLSGGEVQRVALARALAANPDVILMDEPFGALDFYTREKMQTWLLDVWGRNRKTILFITHSIEEAVFLSDRILVLGAGVIRAEFRVEFPRPRQAEIKFSDQFGNLRREIFAAIERD